MTNCLRIKFNKIRFLLILSLGLVFSNTNPNQGSIVEVEFIESMTAQEIFDYLQPILDIFTPLNGYDVDIYSIIYETIDTEGNSTLASGALAIPIVTNGFLPLLSYQHGTQLERDGVSSINGFDIVSMWLGTSGYVTALPDYLGLGVSELFHPYMIYEESATAIIDMLRASKTFCMTNNINLNEQLFLIGYSEGGYTTMAAHKMIEENFSNEFTITASAPSAGPYDLSGAMANLMLSFEPYGQPYYLPFTVLAYQDKYNVVDDIGEYFTDYYAEILPPLFDGYHSATEINNIMPSVPIEIFKPDVIEEFSTDMNHPLRIKLAENDLVDWMPIAPMKIFHSEGDELVPIENSENAYMNFIFNGAPNVDFEHGPWGTHQDAAPIILIGAATWFNELKYYGVIGDINQDNVIDILDVTLLVNIVLDIDSIDDSLFMFADINDDGNLNIYDLIHIMNTILL